MEKLTLAQLSGYLAYGLTGILFDAENEVIEIVTIELVHIPDELTIISSDGEWDIQLEDFKPLVIPLDRLTEAQWIEVFKAGDPERSAENLIAEFTARNGVMVKWCGINVLEYSIDTLSFHHTFAFNQLRAFNKLHELHADLHDWIEKGLGINKLDYEK